MKYKKFKLSEIFKWQSQKEIDPLKIDELTIKNSIKYPFYGQATSNNGIISYESLDEKVLNNKMVFLQFLFILIIKILST